MAERVETLAHWDLLRELECDIAQGHFIGRSMAAAELEDWARQWKPRES